MGVFGPKSQIQAWPSDLLHNSFTVSHLIIGGALQTGLAVVVAICVMLQNSSVLLRGNSFIINGLR